MARGLSLLAGLFITLAAGIATGQVPPIDPALLMQYRNAVNSDWFFAQPGQALMESIEAEQINDLRGLNRRSPWFAFIMLITM